MRKLVQRKFLFFVFVLLIGCSQITDKFSDDSDPVFGSKDYAVSLVADINARWFKQPKKFSLQSDDGEIPKHFFFDVNPDISMEKKTINFVVTTPEGSPNAYEIDLVSGQHYMDHRYCKTTDAWEVFKTKVERPPYTIGIIPRVFDQLGSPQKVLVFGDKKFYQKNYRTNFFDGRVIGGFIEQVCKKGACLEQKQWSSRLVLVVVEPKNKKFSKVRNIDDLKKYVDWPEVKAFAQNGHGQNKVGDRYYPALKMGALVDASTAMSFMRSNSIFFTVKKLTKMRNSCYTLYDHLWKKLKSDSKIEKKFKKVKSRIAIAKLEKLSRKDPNAFFYQRFTNLFKKYEKDIKTCSKYIYSGNIHEDKERFWFFSYLKLFSISHESGYTYSCKRDVWVRNPYTLSGKRAIPLKKEFRNCNAHKMDKAFSMAVNLLNSLKRNNLKSYRFIDYDRGALGTHNKLYSWVPISPRRYECSNTKEYKLTRRTFPKDIRWKKRRIKNAQSVRLFY